MLESGSWGHSVLQTTSSSFVCVEVLQPSQPNGVMSNTNSLPNHTFNEQAKPSKRLTVLCTFYLQKLTTAFLESAEGRE